MTETTCHCGNCDWVGTVDQAEPCRDFWSRVEPGDTVPAGDCPECGAFAFIGSPEAPPVRLYVIMDGGLVQEVVSPDDPSGVELWVIDYDTEGADRDELSDVTFDTSAEAVAYPVTIGPCTAPTIADIEDEDEEAAA